MLVEYYFRVRTRMGPYTRIRPRDLKLNVHVMKSHMVTQLRFLPLTAIGAKELALHYLPLPFSQWDEWAGVAKSPF